LTSLLRTLARCTREPRNLRSSPKSHKTKRKKPVPSVEKSKENKRKLQRLSSSEPAKLIKRKSKHDNL
jgi:hypothetical protein